MRSCCKPCICPKGQSSSVDIPDAATYNSSDVTRTKTKPVSCKQTGRPFSLSNYIYHELVYLFGVKLTSRSPKRFASIATNTG